MTILEAKNLTKVFGDFKAVDNISFKLKEGEILGLLGPNGAGKTTTLQMLLGLLTPTQGEILYFGKNFFTHRSEILEEVNFSSAYTKLPWLLTVRENLNFVSYLYNIKNRKARIQKIVEIFSLQELMDKELRNLSAGQLTRINIAKSFLNFPKVLLLDEPTASLDPEVAAYIREFLANQRKEFEVSIVITSHNMAEVEELCDRVVFINGGQIIADDTPLNLARTMELSHMRLLILQPKSFINYCNKHKISCVQDGRYVIVDIKEKEIPIFLRSIMEEGITYDEISIERPTLEDYFLQKARKQ